MYWPRELRPKSKKTISESLAVMRDKAIYMLSRSQSKGVRSTYKLLTGFNWPDGGHRINLGSPDA